MAKPTPAELLTLIAERAPALRKAGVQAFTIDGFSVSLAAAEPAAQEPAKADDDAVDPLKDPMTYGGRSVPGFTLEEDDDEDHRRGNAVRSG